MDKIIDSVETLELKIKEIRLAQQKFATYSQEQVDQIFKCAAIAANQNRIKLAKLAVEETGMGIVEDKVIKNHYASEYIYNAYRNTQTCGVIEEDKTYGIKNQKFNLEGQLLHAFKLELSHPSTNERMTFDAKLPEYFEKVLNKLRLQNN